MAPLPLLLLALMGPAEGPALGSPRLARGDELIYEGTVEEAGERIDNRFRKRHELKVRVFVLEAADGYADCAVLTSVRPLFDPVVAGPAAAVTGADPARRPALPAVRLELVRVDPRGRVRVLAPPALRLPLDLTPRTPTVAAPPAPLDTVPAVELDLFVPLPPRPATLGTSWAVAEPGRPPLVLTAHREAVWNGGRCLEVASAQQTDGWDRPTLAATGWRRTEVRCVVPGDGYACRVVRRVERREGASLVGWVETTYEAQPASRYHGARYLDVRREVEQAYAFAADVEALVARGGRPDAGAFRARLAAIEKYGEEFPFRTGFREAIEAVRRRCEAGARGEVLAVAPVVPAGHEAPAGPPEPGRPAPDFVAPLVHAAGQFRLSAERGQPVVLVFYRPGSKTSAAALRVAEALHRTFAGQAAVAALAISAPADEAERQRGRMKLTVPVLDGSGVRPAYAVETYPRWLVIDPTGLLAWQFEGHGDEVGYLVKKELGKLVR